MSLADLRAGVDRILGPPRGPEIYRGVSPGFPHGGRFPEPPPGRGSILGSEDPIRFGSSRLVAFTPLGTASSGTIYLTDNEGLAAVVLYGPTARVRVWRYDERSGGWRR